MLLIQVFIKHFSVSLDGADDLILLDDCDKMVRDICSNAGWQEELNSLEVQILEPWYIYLVFDFN